MQGKRTLVGQDLIEVIDLYVWGARVVDIATLYDVHKTTIRENVRRAGVQLRTSSRPLRKRINGKIPFTGRERTRSSPQKKPVVARRVVDALTPDQLLRSSARAQQDKRTAEHRVDESKRFYQEVASECRYAFLRNGNRLPDLE